MRTGWDRSLRLESPARRSLRFFCPVDTPTSRRRWPSGPTWMQPSWMELLRLPLYGSCKSRPVAPAQVPQVASKHWSGRQNGSSAVSSSSTC
ncbi:hypothetical protein C8T65DRAFT_671174 [Cerioporus squamosus]|nr:hypothetical protein C8T65DRAFT_671174 [Cerioporus squamosus]